MVRLWCVCGGGCWVTLVRDMWRSINQPIDRCLGQQSIDQPTQHPPNTRSHPLLLHTYSPPPPSPAAAAHSTARPKSGTETGRGTPPTPPRAGRGSFGGGPGAGGGGSGAAGRRASGGHGRCGRCWRRRCCRVALLWLGVDWIGLDWIGASVSQSNGIVDPTSIDFGVHPSTRRAGAAPLDRASIEAWNASPRTAWASLRQRARPRRPSVLCSSLKHLAPFPLDSIRSTRAIDPKSS